MQDFTNKVVVITGGASGIGAAICDVFAREGSKLVIGDIEHSKAETVARNIREKGGQPLDMNCLATR